MRLLAFAEVVVDQTDERVHRRLGIITNGFDRDRSPFAGRQHHYAHNTFTVDAPTVALQPDFTLEGARQLRELGGSPGMKPQLVDDFDVLAQRRHRCSLWSAR